MPRPSDGWLDRLPSYRPVAEFSLRSADLFRLADELARVEPYADLLHVDVSDGHFTPALMFFPQMVAAVRKRSSLPIHVHLMVDDVSLLAQVEQFVAAGADLISIHVEYATSAGAALDYLDAVGVPAGMVLKVDTPVAAVKPYLPRLRFLTLLGARIGMRGQPVDDKAPARLEEARALVAAHPSSRIVVAADGGIGEHTVPRLRAAGAESVVLGSLAFAAPNLGARMAWLHAL